METKNIFVLPTTEPSQVYLIKLNRTLALTSTHPDAMEHFGSGTHNQHIYFTNDDFFKKGDWCIDVEDEIVFKIEETKEFSNILKSSKGTFVYTSCKKIAFTTDAKLIADGVTEIEEDFLKSFVEKAKDSGKPIDIVKIKKSKYRKHNFTGSWIRLEDDDITTGAMFRDGIIEKDELFLVEEELQQEKNEETKDLFYWKTNAEEDYLHVPISVLRYISELEKEVNTKYNEEDMKSAFKVGFSIGYGSDVYAIDEKDRTCDEWFEKNKKK